MTIHLGRPLPGASCNQPGRRCRKRIPPRAMPEAVPSLFGFAPGGVYLASACCQRAVRSYRTLSPLPGPDGPGRFAFCGTFPGVAPAGRYPAPCFRGARTFLHPKSTRPCGPQSASRAAAIRPTSKLTKGCGPPRVKMASEKMHGLYGEGTFRRVFAITAGVNHKQRQLGVTWQTEEL